MNSYCFVICWYLYTFSAAKRSRGSLPSVPCGWAIPSTFPFGTQTVWTRWIFLRAMWARGFRTLYYGPSHICSHLLRSMSVADGWNLVCYTKRLVWSKVCKVTYTPVHLTGDQGLLSSNTEKKDQGITTAVLGRSFPMSYLTDWIYKVVS